MNETLGGGIMVTRSMLPPLEEYVDYLKLIWQSHHLTNSGPLSLELEKRLKEFLGCDELSFVSNGTIALQLALKALDVRGEVITSPFSYVATTSAILWENCSPVFVDVRPQDLTIDPKQIAAAITPRTSAILATHVYGFPCELEAIARLARQYKLKVIYDAAHTFGCRVDGRHLATYGDISCLSFHATKVFHTAEGGAVVINGDPPVAERVRLMRSFGHSSDDHRCVGINGKNSELHAAMGLCNLPRVPAALAMRQRLHAHYVQLLAGSAVKVLHSAHPNLDYNYAYFPVLLPDGAAVARTLAILAAKNIHPRRYFFPSINQIPYIQGGACPVSERAAQSVLCLPLSDLVSAEVQETVATAILQATRY
ncbi:DegT/DnrJ/EryC1/StrS family aminotransferase [Opitutus sp. GAS368]|uniref:DegT/DnrJ/EryC1/StrS family aminotransferase n=1 Tax=Opitutus sp. GAS368 TaxID=1882749 RepID=UPI0008798277|nr:DegT/DnrJ/EryC1/StrS family aminotransferase [Opitutus sp. GAS368]SDS27321.1 dTDP-4-amino-4,6-dideoxygalactose transaminase [Opitutus sp. GAS368]